MHLLAVQAILTRARSTRTHCSASVASRARTTWCSSSPKRDAATAIRSTAAARTCEQPEPISVPRSRQVSRGCARAHADPAGPRTRCSPLEAAGRVSAPSRGESAKWLALPAAIRRRLGGQLRAHRGRVDPQRGGLSCSASRARSATATTSSESAHTNHRARLSPPLVVSEVVN